MKRTNIPTFDSLERAFRAYPGTRHAIVNGKGVVTLYRADMTEYRTIRLSWAPGFEGERQFTNHA